MSDVQTTQSKYQKKRKSEGQPQIEENEVRIKGNQGHVKRYVDYACRLLLGAQNFQRPQRRTPDDKDAAADDEDKKDDDDAPKKFDSIVLKATGRAINKAVTTAEVVKRRIGGLHQVTSLETLEITDVWEPTEAGLKEVETKRRVASITITLSRDESKIDKNAPGYQIPINADAIKPFFGNQNRRGFRRFRGGRRGRSRRGGYNRGGYYNRNFRGGFNRNFGGGGQRNYRGRGRGGGGGGNYNRSPNRSPGGGGYGRGRRGRGGGGGGYRGGYGGRSRGRGGFRNY